MESEGRGDQKHHTQREPEPAAQAAASVDAYAQSEFSSRLGAHSYERASPDVEGEQPSSLTDNLSQRVQDEVGAENERGAGGDDPNNYPLHSSWAFWFDRCVPTRA